MKEAVIETGRLILGKYPMQHSPEPCAAEGTKDIRMQLVKDCPCKRRKCPRFGNCEACRAHHAASKRPRPCEKGGAGRERGRKR